MYGKPNFPRRRMKMTRMMIERCHDMIGLNNLTRGKEMGIATVFQWVKSTNFTGTKEMIRA